MKLAILGGGITGLSAAHYLLQKGHRITIFEKKERLGGLAGGFKVDGWQWYLEKTIHHLFANDKDILSFIKEIGFDDVFFQKPETASLYKNPNYKSQVTNEFQIYPLDTPIDLLKFRPLSFVNRIRAGAVIAFIKLSPFFPLYEKQTAAEFLEKKMGNKTYQILFGELFRKKFGKYAENILASFIWARIKKRTKKLGYISGGFQVLINQIENQLIGSKVNILKNYEVKEVKKTKGKFLIAEEKFDGVISTLPTPVLIKTAAQIFPKKFIDRLKKIKFLHSVSLIIESEKPLFDKAYWVNILASEIPIMGLFQQTNFVDKKYYGNKHILYCGWYVTEDDRLWSMSKDEIISHVLPYLNRISNFKFQILNSWLFKERFAQPIFDREFLKNKPEFITPIKNFYLANLDMTYPYDRGTNYAVKLGKKLAELI